MGKRTATADSGEDVIALILQNPYAPETASGSRALEAAGLLPCGAAAWRRWWSALPPYLQQDEAAVTALLVSLGREANERDRQALDASLARALPAEVLADCAEIACRANAVTRRLDSIAGDSAAMRDVRRTCWAAAFGETLATVSSRARLFQTTPVLIQGETGTGKELVATALGLSMKGSWSRERGWQPAPFEAVHLASLPSELVQSTLFGHEKGAYTGATNARRGVLERCHQGVVFLDEVAELPLETQVALLRTLQEGKARRLGADVDADAAPRIVSATHQDLEALVARDRFRLDLLYRLSSVTIRVPPLRDRAEDIDGLAEREIQLVATPGSRGELIDRFRAFRQQNQSYRWPGNVRELHAVVRTLALGLTPRLRAFPATSDPSMEAPQGVREASWSLQEVQRWYCALVADRTRNHSKAAERLGIDRGTLRRHLEGARHG